jgi:hypothetical protein
MRFYEFNPQLRLDEGGKSSGRRYNSEVAILCALTGVDISTFDPNNASQSLPAQAFDNPKVVYNDIKKLLGPNFEPDLFRKWYEIGSNYAEIINAKMSQSGDSIGQLSWAGGKNQAENAADVGFVGSNIAGISIKAEGGITLANLTPKALGLTPDKGNDIFYHYAQEEFKDMKTKIFTDVLNLAQSTPGEVISPLSEKYSIMFDPNTQKFTCKGKKTLTADATTILASVAKNSSWQRVFGDWFQANWQNKKAYATPLFKKIAKAFEVTIEEHLQQSSSLTNMLRFAKQPYFYISTTGLYYVPGLDEVQDLKLMGLKYGAPDGTSQLFVAQIGRPDSKQFAELDIYVRYANGMFEANPTVRVQTLRNPQFISWEKLA